MEFDKLICSVLMDFATVRAAFCHVSLDSDLETVVYGLPVKKLADYGATVKLYAGWARK